MRPVPLDRRAVPAESDAELLARAAAKARRLVERLRADADALRDGGPGEACAPAVAEAAKAAAAVAEAFWTDDEED